MSRQSISDPHLVNSDGITHTASDQGHELEDYQVETL